MVSVVVLGISLLLRTNIELIPHTVQHLKVMLIADTLAECTARISTLPEVFEITVKNL